MPARRDRKGKKACGFACETGYLKIHLAASNHCYIRVARWFRDSDTWGGWLSKAVRWRRASSKVAVGWKSVFLGAQSSGVLQKEISSGSVRPFRQLHHAGSIVQPWKIFAKAFPRADARCRYAGRKADRLVRQHCAVFSCIPNSAVGLRW